MGQLFQELQKFETFRQFNISHVLEEFVGHDNFEARKYRRDVLMWK